MKKVLCSRLWLVLVATSSMFGVARPSFGQTIEPTDPTNPTEPTAAVSITQQAEPTTIASDANGVSFQVNPTVGAAVNPIAQIALSSDATAIMAETRAAALIATSPEAVASLGMEETYPETAMPVEPAVDPVAIAADRVNTALANYQASQLDHPSLEETASSTATALNSLTETDPARINLPEGNLPGSDLAEIALPSGENSPQLAQANTSPNPNPNTNPRPNPNANGASGNANNSAPQVLVSEVVVRPDRGTLNPELEALVYEVIRTQPGRTTTSVQLQNDINAIYATGFFGRVEPLAEETPIGVRVIFVVRQNPQLNGIALRNNQVLTQTVVDEIFGAQYGNILNLRDFQRGIEAVNQWYEDNGYALAQVVDPPPIPTTGPAAPPPVSADGKVTLDVAEGEIEDIRLRFLNEDGEEFDEEGNPVDGRTRPFIVTREMRTQPGDVFNSAQIQADLQRVYGLGLFEDVNLAVEPGTDPRKAILTINAVEGRSGSVAAGGGFSSSSGFFGTLSYQEQNLGGNDQTLGAEFQLGTRGFFFDVNFTDPWIGGDPYRTSYNINLFKRRSISLVFDSGTNQPEIELPNGDRPRVDRLGAGVTFSRPLSRDVFERESAWLASLGFTVQEVSIRDADGTIRARDELGNLLSYDDDGTDFLASVRFGLSYDQRNDRLNPSSGYRVSFSTEQTLPLNNIFFNSLQASYSYFIPVDFTQFQAEGAETIALNVRAGTILGDFPAYEAFVLGGVNSVRGYEEGALGAGRSFIQASAEYRFPILSFLGGVVFLDAATDLGSGGDVPGDPAGVREKPGSGFGYGVGVRINSPIGPIRVDYALNDDGDSRFHFGIGQRF